MYVYGFVRLCVNLQIVLYMYKKIKLNCPKNLTLLFVHHGSHSSLRPPELIGTIPKRTQNPWHLAAETRGYLCF